MMAGEKEGRRQSGEEDMYVYLKKKKMCDVVSIFSHFFMKPTFIAFAVSLFARS